MAESQEDKVSWGDLATHCLNIIIVLPVRIRIRTS